MFCFFISPGKFVKISCSNGWLVWLRRLDGSVSFNRPWASYKEGFGDADGEFWLGLEMLHTLTSNDHYKLRVEMSDWNGFFYQADYNSFEIGPESGNYRLTCEFDIISFI